MTISKEQYRQICLTAPTKQFRELEEGDMVANSEYNAWKVVGRGYVGADGEKKNMPDMSKSDRKYDWFYVLTEEQFSWYK